MNLNRETEGNIRDRLHATWWCGAHLPSPVAFPSCCSVKKGKVGCSQADGVIPPALPCFLLRTRTCVLQRNCFDGWARRAVGREARIQAAIQDGYFEQDGACSIELANEYDKPAMRQPTIPSYKDRRMKRVLIRLSQYSFH